MTTATPRNRTSSDDARERSTHKQNPNLPERKVRKFSLSLSLSLSRSHPKGRYPTNRSRYPRASLPRLPSRSGSPCQFTQVFTEQRDTPSQSSKTGLLKSEIHLELDAFEELIAIDDLGITIGHHVRVLNQDHLNPFVHVELTRPM